MYIHLALLIGKMRWKRMTEKPKRVCKDGLWWGYVPKEAYGKEMYVLCTQPYHYLSLGIKGDEE